MTTRPRIIELSIDELVLPLTSEVERRRVARLVSARVVARLDAATRALVEAGAPITIDEVEYDARDAWAPALLADAIAAAIVRKLTGLAHRDAEPLRAGNRSFDRT